MKYNIIYPGHSLEQQNEMFETWRKRSTEAYSIALCGLTDSNTNSKDLLIKKIFLAQESDLVSHSGGEVTPKGTFLAKIFKEAQEKGLGVLETHTHLSTIGNFSGGDHINGLENGKEMSSLGIKWFMCVQGEKGYEFMYYDDKQDKLIKSTAEIKTLSRRGRSTININNTQKNELSDYEKKIYDRQIILLGEETQKLLSELKVGIIGLGGGGNLLVQNLVRIGIKKFVLCDDDKLEYSNLPRYPIAFKKDVGRYKAEISADYIKNTIDDAEVEIKRDKIQNVKDAFKNVDWIFGGVDSEGARKIINELSIRYYIPYIDFGTEIFLKGNDVIEMGGQVRIVIPSVTGCLECFNGINMEEALYENEDPEVTKYVESAGYVRNSNLTPTPSILALNNIIVSFGIQEFINMVKGFNIESDQYNYIKYDAINNTLQKMMFDKNETCSICGCFGFAGKGDSKSNPKLFFHNETNMGDLKMDIS